MLNYVYVDDKSILVILFKVLFVWYKVWKQKHKNAQQWQDGNNQILQRQGLHNIYKYLHLKLIRLI